MDDEKYKLDLTRKRKPWACISGLWQCQEEAVLSLCVRVCEMEEEEELAEGHGDPTKGR